MMKGLGRNIRFLMWMMNKAIFIMWASLILMFMFFGLIEGDPLGFLSEMLPIWILMMLVYAVLINSLSSGDVYFLTAVSFGSARRQIGIAMAIALHIILVEQGLLLLVCALLIEDSKQMQVVRTCPMGVIAMLLMVLSFGTLLSIINIRLGKERGAIVTLISLLVITMGGVVFAAMNGFEINVEQFKQFNNPLLLLVGLVVDIVAAWIYCKAVRNADLKLA